MGSAALALALLLAQESGAPGHWPGFRGPNRDNVSTETGLLKEWPEGGPPLLWKAQGIGEGLGCVSVAGGLIFAQGNREAQDWVTALEGRGKIVWSVPIGPASGERGLMRYVTQRSPTVDDSLLYVTTWQGMISCLESATGRIVWRKSYSQDFGGRTPPWAFGDAPIVDGKLLVCAPGGNRGTLAALNKADGALVWRSTELKEAVNAAIVPAEIGGIRQYVVFTYASVAGVSSRDGRLLWKAERKGQTAVVSAPVVHDGIVFVTSGFGVGCNAFRINSADGAFKVEEIYRGRQLENQHGGVVRVGDHLYGTDNNSLKCVELKTGNEVWTNRCVGKGAVTVADGLIICRSERGPLALLEATPQGYRERGRFNQPDRTPDLAHTHPVVAGGRLYLRDQDSLYCYDVRGPDFKTPAPVWDIISRLAPKGVPAAASLPPAEGKAPDAAFVPTPMDVVEKMLDLARVTKDDVVYDLGSGDGRILIAAAEKYGCKAVGYEINPELVKLSRAKAREAKVDAWVTIEEKDLFTADLGRATVVTLYLGEANNKRLLPQLRQLKDGSRIVSHAHLLGLPELKPEKTVTMVSKEDGAEHTIHLWTAPLTK
jgi:outer membrane protein assembly factor BamB